MQSKIDGHTHSTCSDGTDSPVELIRKAKVAGLEVIAITDHDNIDAILLASEEADDLGITLVKGIELSVDYSDPCYKGGKSIELHVLGYNIDPANDLLTTTLQDVNQYRSWRAGEVRKKVNAVLQEEGHPTITEREFSDLQRRTEGSLGRPHIGRLLVAKGIVRNLNEAFDTYLHACNVRKKEIPLAEGCELIRHAGGKAVLAHPHGPIKTSLANLSEDIDVQRLILRSMREHLDGLECFYWEHTAEETAHYLQTAKQLGLMVTGGSDHHGGVERERIGKMIVPYYVGETLVGL